MCSCFKGIKDAVKKDHFYYVCKHCGCDITVAYFLALETAGKTSEKEDNP